MNMFPHWKHKKISKLTMTSYLSQAMGNRLLALKDCWTLGSMLLARATAPANLIHCNDNLGEWWD